MSWEDSLQCKDMTDHMNTKENVELVDKGLVNHQMNQKQGKQEVDLSLNVGPDVLCDWRFITDFGD